MSNWFDYQNEKTAPKPAYKRPMPTFERKVEPKPEPIKVEEDVESPSMILRVIGKLRGG